MTRIQFELRDGEAFNILLDGEWFGYSDCHEFAVIADMAIGYHSSIFKSRGGKYAKVSIIAADGADRSPYGIHTGWYSAHIISEKEANAIKSSWAVLRDQPVAPGGPWA